jgi:L-amino acid N-acyltransferase YncA
MTIRHAEAARDAAAVAEIYGWYVRETAISFEEAAPSAADTAALIARIQRTHPWLVCEREGAVVGWACGSPHRERAAYRWAADVAIYVDREARGGGVGRALYEALLPLLREQGLHVACAGITLPNEASVGLHEALGFEPVGVYRRVGWKAGAWRDVGWWQLELRPAGDGPPPEPRPPAQASSSGPTGGSS